MHVQVGSGALGHRTLSADEEGGSGRKQLAVPVFRRRTHAHMFMSKVSKALNLELYSYSNPRKEKLLWGPFSYFSVRARGSYFYFFHTYTRNTLSYHLTCGAAGGSVEFGYLLPVSAFFRAERERERGPPRHGRDGVGVAVVAAAASQPQPRSLAAAGYRLHAARSVHAPSSEQLL